VLYIAMFRIRSVKRSYTQSRDARSTFNKVDEWNVKYLHHIDLEDVISHFLRNVVPVYRTARRRIPVTTVR